LKMDHTTMIHAKQRITSLMASDDSLRDRVLALETKILAAFHRASVPAISQPHLGCEKEQQDRGEGQDAVREIPTMDTGS